MPTPLRINSPTGKKYEYDVICFRLNTDRDHGAFALEEMRRLGLKTQEYIRHIISERMGVHSLQPTAITFHESLGGDLNQSQGNAPSLT